MRTRTWGYTPVDPEGRHLITLKSLTRDGAWRRLTDSLSRHAGRTITKELAMDLGYEVKSTGLPEAPRW